ncbi:TIGR00725 family protein [Candidatus Peregrinibacteria bacterium]|nr:TIGR00725 family protein [Candidatus Peregrinibacteria bacterium]
MIKRKTIIGIMGPGDHAKEKDVENAHELGRMIAENKWVLLTGGRNVGVMDAASRGAQEAGGLVIGVMPGPDTSETSDYVDIAIITNMGSARNSINVLTSDVVIACGIGSGTASEIALALKAEKNVILFSDNEESKAFFRKLDEQKIHIARTRQEVIEKIKDLL